MSRNTVKYFQFMFLAATFIVVFYGWFVVAKSPEPEPGISPSNEAWVFPGDDIARGMKPNYAMICLNDVEYHFLHGPHLLSAQANIQSLDGMNPEPVKCSLKTNYKLLPEGVFIYEVCHGGQLFYYFREPKASALAIKYLSNGKTATCPK